MQLLRDSLHPYQSVYELQQVDKLAVLLALRDLRPIAVFGTTVKGTSFGDGRIWSEIFDI